MTAGRSVLIIDDNEANVVLLEYLLTTSGYDVRSTVDAEAALVSIAEHRPELILTDIQLPGVSGLELAQRLKADASTADIRIIAISAFAMPADEQRALAAGCDFYVAKPIDTRAFPAIVAGIMGPA
jgi:two-component system cell cycle response regulator DivK